MKELFNNKKVIAIYSIWLFIHICFYLLSERTYLYEEVFWPMKYKHVGYDVNKGINAYDFSELFVYALLPVLIAFVYYSFKKKK